MSRGNVIHIMLDPEEAIEIRKKFLQIQLTTLNMAKKISLYSTIRSRELRTKVRLASKIRGTNMNMRKLQRDFPEIETTETMIREKSETPEEKAKEKRKPKNEIESELMNIQAKLRVLQDNQ